MILSLPDMAPLYCDYAATTPVAPEVARRMHDCLSDDLLAGNPSSRTHAWGRQAQDLVDGAVADIAAALGVAATGIVLTSGATEADNLAVLGAGRYAAGAGSARHVISSRIEHKAVVDAVQQLEREGCAVTWLEPDAEGRIDAAQLSAALRDDTILVALMWVNNELGVVNDVEGYARALEGHPAILHVDAAQAFGKLADWSVPERVDTLALTAHKFYGPKGAGALWVRDRLGVNLLPLLYGGGQQRGLRPGTLPTHQIVGLASAALLARQEVRHDVERLTMLGERLVDGLLSVPGVALNGPRSGRLAWLANVRVAGVHGALLMSAMAPIAVSAGSACNSRDLAPSFVLKALGLADADAAASLRISLGRGSDEEGLTQLLERFEAAVLACRRISARWTAA